MPRISRRALLVSAAGCALPIAARGNAPATDFPNRPLQLVVPLGPGGVGDTGARIIAKRLADELGQSVVVENRPGGNQIVGIGHVARSAPDGYTLLWTTSGFSASPVLVKDFPFDPLRDFQPVAMGATSNNVIVGSTNFPGGTLKDFVDYSKRNPGKVFYGSPSGATTLVLEYLKLVTGAQMEGVMYKGTPNAWTDLIGGRIDILLDGPALARGQIEAGRARGLVVCGSRRAPELPNTPTAAESGFPDFVIETWQGLLAPAKTPAPVIRRLEAAMTRVLTSDEVRRQLADAGLDAGTPSADAFTATIRRYADLWASVGKQAGIQPQ